MLWKSSQFLSAGKRLSTKAEKKYAQPKPRANTSSATAGQKSKANSTKQIINQVGNYTELIGAAVKPSLSQFQTSSDTYSQSSCNLLMQWESTQVCRIRLPLIFLSYSWRLPDHTKLFASVGKTHITKRYGNLLMHKVLALWQGRTTAKEI